MKSLRLFVFLLLQFSLMTSFANNPGVSYQGRIFKPDGNPLEGSSVQFRLQVRSPGSENCLLYEEVQTLNMAGSSGVFALTLNDGTGTRLDTATYQVDRIFANRETMTLDTTRCAAGTTYTPNSSDGRKLVVYFKDETMAAYEAMPLMNLNYVPQAMYALEAQKVDKFEVSHILRAVDGSGNPATAPALNPTQLTNLNTLLATPAANYVQTTSNGSAALPIVAGNPSSGLAAGQIWYDSGSNVMKYYDGAVKTFGTSGGGVTSVATGTGLTGGPITTTGTINVDVGVTTGKIVQVAASNKLPVIDGSNLTNITATDATKLPLAGGTMTGPLVNNSNSASTALAVTQAGAGYAASFMGGNVGIGTSSPAGTLDVQGGTAAASTSGTSINIVAQNGGTGGNFNGGSVSITGGNSNLSGLSGDINITSGGSAVQSKVGNINITTPSQGSDNSSTGIITLSAAGYGGTNHGGYLQLQGNSASNTGGDVVLRSGNGVMSSGNPGKVSISGGSSWYNTGGAVEITGGAGGNTTGIGGNVVIAGGAKQGAGTVGNVILAASGGNVGIGTTTPQTTLQVAGIISPAVDNTTTLGSATYRFTTVYATNGTINTSDRREKKDIYDTDLGLDFINKLRPVSYRWNTGIDNDVHYGLIAQEAEQVIDEIGKGGKTSIVTHDETTDRFGVRYSELISPLIKAVQEIYRKFLGVDREIASVKAEANAKTAKLEAENAELKARLDQQETELAAIKKKLGL